MKNLYLDPLTYDIKIGTNFNLQFTSTLSEYVSQKIENALSVFEGEWFLNQFIGIPYFTRILIKNADLNDVNSILLAAITAIPEVDEVLSFETEFDSATRHYTVDFAVRISSGETVSGEVTL